MSRLSFRVNLPPARPSAPGPRFTLLEALLLAIAIVILAVAAAGVITFMVIRA